MPPAVEEQAKLGLVFQLLGLLGAPLGQWQCSNLETETCLPNTTENLSQDLASLLLCGEPHTYTHAFSGFPKDAA